MKQLKQTLNTALLTKFLINKNYLLLESSTFFFKQEKNSFNFIQNFTKKIAKHTFIAKDLKGDNLKFPLNLMTFNGFMDFNSYIKFMNLKKATLQIVFIKLINYLFLTSSFVLNINDSNKTFLDIRLILSYSTNILKVLNLKKLGQL